MAACRQLAEIVSHDVSMQVHLLGGPDSKPRGDKFCRF